MPRENPLQSARASNPPGCLTDVANELRLSQAIVIPPNSSILVTSGQCGFKDDLSLPSDLRDEIMLAFENAEKTLQTAGATEGWKHVYQITTYAPRLDEAWLDAMQEAKQKYLGDNRPVWTGVTVPSLYGGARLEMTLNAFIPPLSSSNNCHERL
ncbi:endoribonuclease l-PSP domain-containing protein [Penicillium angulare]|uniref:Endoribonuclease l-PSP domain-containing protein n=1 Tax=Penicillium angulare TaxID=116970 RepID=A0A9W9FYE4_9EURO|nr:endoribonuclease l-PSP domain-containing protein [Penicillium angulare]